MKTKILVIIVALSLVGAFSGVAAAGVLGYSLDKADRGFERKADPQPSSSAVAFDGLIARPVGLATTLVGTGLFVVTLPFSIPSRSVRESAHGMIGRPGGWTFVRPMGQKDKRFRDEGVFGR